MAYFGSNYINFSSWQDISHKTGILIWVSKPIKGNNLNTTKIGFSKTVNSETINILHWLENEKQAFVHSKTNISWASKLCQMLL